MVSAISPSNIKSLASVDATNENNMEQLERITHHPDIMGGKACIRNMRVTVSMVVNQMAAGHTIEQVLIDYPYLEKEDIFEHRDLIVSAPQHSLPQGS